MPRDLLAMSPAWLKPPEGTFSEPVRRVETTLGTFRKIENWFFRRKIDNCPAAPADRAAGVPPAMLREPYDGISGAAMSVRDSVTVLHVSDLQFGPRHRFDDEGPLGTLLDRLEQDLERLRVQEDLQFF